MTSYLILSHDLNIDGVGVSDYVTSFEIKGSADQIVIPATSGRNVESVATGAERWEITINYLQGEAAGSLQEILFDVFLNDESKLCTYSGKMRDHSAKRYAGIFAVTEVISGGEVNSLGIASHTFMCTARPTITVPGS